MTSSIRMFACIGFLAAMAASPALAAGCPEQFLGGRAPVIINVKLATKARELCFQEFATLHSGVTRTPLYSAEHLTRARVEGARGQRRVNTFKEEVTLPMDERAALADYARSGFDRGHMAPSGDMSNPQAQDESFTLANMVPQAAVNNRGIWAAIEKAVRDLAARDEDVYVVTGPVFKGTQLSTVPNGRVFVPTHVFKAIWVRSTGQSGVYLAPNDDSGSWTPVSLNALSTLVGFDVFPAATTGKDVAMALPQPNERVRH